MATYFISDLHVSEQQQEITSLLLQFLKRIEAKADALYVLGDLFNYWVGDDYSNATIEQVKQGFFTLVQSGVPVYFIQGNRDFLIGKRFCRESGIQLLADEAVVDLYGQPVLLMHGDTLCTLDDEYQAFRKTSRSWWWQAFMLRLPLALRLKKAERYRQVSYASMSNKSPELMDVAEQTVVEKMQQFDCRTLIHGHTHKPAFHPIKLNSHTTGQRIVLEDWHPSGQILRCTANSQPELIDVNLFLQ